MGTPMGAANNKHLLAANPIGLTKRYSGHDRDAVHDLMIFISAGRIVGLLRQKCAGKTTLAEPLRSITPPNRGADSVFGLDPHHHVVETREMISVVQQLRHSEFFGLSVAAVPLGVLLVLSVVLLALVSRAVVARASGL